MHVYYLISHLSVCSPHPHHILKPFSMVHFTANVCLWLCTSLLGVAGLTESQVCPDFWLCTAYIFANCVLTEYKYPLSFCRVNAPLKRNHSYVCTTACNISSSSSCQINKTRPQSKYHFCMQFPGTVREPQHNSNHKTVALMSATRSFTYKCVQEGLNGNLQSQLFCIISEIFISHLQTFPSAI